MITNVQNYNRPTFTAHIPETLGKKACDKLAKRFIASNDIENIQFATDYFVSLERIKNEKGIKEVIIRTTDHKQTPDVWCDGLPLSDMTVCNPRKFKNKNDQEVYDLMRHINLIANNIPAIIKAICTR